MAKFYNFIVTKIYLNKIYKINKIKHGQKYAINIHKAHFTRTFYIVCLIHIQTNYFLDKSRK